MSGKLLKNSDISVEELVKDINEVIDNNFKILDERDDIEKWNSLPNLLLLDEVSQKRFLSFVQFLDSVDILIEDKIIILISLVGLMEFGNIKLYDYDDASLYTMADYYQNSSIDDIKKTITIIGNKELLLAVRKKTLDLELRKKILLDIAKRIFNDKIDSTNSNQLNNFISKIIEEVETKDY